MRTCIIPARGGSKRIYKKNIKEFCGEPMLAYAIKAALGSQCFDNVVVSTDCTETKVIAERYGATVPSLRPASISDDTSTILDVMAYESSRPSLRRHANQLIACVFGTNPFLSPETLKSAVERFEGANCDYLISICEFPSPLQRALKIVRGDFCEMVEKNNALTFTQNFEPRYYDAAQFYIASGRTWMEKKPIFGGNSAFIELPPNVVRDIDTPEDWRIAEQMFRR